MKCHNCNREIGSERKCPECGNLRSPVPLIGRLAIKYKTVSREQLNQSLAIHNKLPEKIPLEQIWIKRRYAKKDQIDLLLIIKEFMTLQELDKVFIKIALEEGFINEAQLEEAKIKQYKQFRTYKKVRIIGEILVEDNAISLDDCNSILSIQKRSLIIKEEDSVKNKDSMEKNENNFLEVRKLDEQFAKIAVKNSVVSKENILKALRKQVDEFKNQSRVLLVGEILVSQGLINYRHAELILKKQGRFKALNGLKDRYLNKITKKDVDDDNSKPLELIISEDKMTALIKVNGDSGYKPDLNELKKLLIDNKIKYGIVGKDPINSFLLGKISKNFIIAKGKPCKCASPSKIEYHFDRDIFIRQKLNSNYDPLKFDEERKNLQVKKGTVLATKTPMESPEKGINVFGESVDPDDIHLHAGFGTILSNSGLEILADRSGEVRLSMDDKVHVLSRTNLLEDADVRSGPFEFDNFIVAGIVTDAFPVKGGDLKAEEIRGAKLEMIGDIEVEIGIIGARIKTQGSVKAKYIHNSQIEAFGDVVTEHEIIDSSILSSSLVKSMKSRIVSSSVSAKRGIFSKGIGTGSSIPCMLNIGVDDHIDNEIREIEINIDRMEKRLISLAALRDGLKENESSLKNEFENRKKNVEILDELLKNLDSEIEEYKRKKDKKLLRDSNVKKSKATAGLRNEREIKNRVSKEYNDVVEKLKTADAEFRSYKRESEKIMKELSQKRKSYLSWKDRVKALKILRIDGDLVSGTTITGPNSSVTIRDDYSNVKIMEVNDPKDPSKWDLRVEKDGKLIKLL